MKHAASAVALSTLAESTALADLPPPIDQIGFWNRLNQWLAMPSSRCVKTHDRIPRAVRQIAFGVFVALLFVIGGLVWNAAVTIGDNIERRMNGLTD